MRIPVTVILNLQIKKLRRQIAQKNKSLKSTKAAERERVEAEIEKLKQELAKCYPPFETEVADDENSGEDERDG